MHPVQVQPLSRIALANNFRTDQATIFGRLMAFVGAVLGLRRRTRAKHDAVPHYEGHAWCDSLECQVNSDIATCRRARL
jgi:hypothetical protein